MRDHAGPSSDTDYRRRVRTPRCCPEHVLATATLAICLTAAAWMPGSAALAADGTTHPHQPVVLELYHPVGTSSDPDLSTAFRLALIYGRVGEIRALDLSPGVAVVQRDLHGVQLTGLYSHLQGDASGLTVAGLIQRRVGDGDGLQLSGLANFVGGHQRGLQLAGLFNFGGGGFSGVQISSVYNYAEGPSGFLQYGLVANVSNGDYRGAQVGPGFNFATQSLRGAQLGAANMAVACEGLQFGLLNIAGELEGLQIGAINLTKHNGGVPVGLFNGDATGGKVDWIVAGSNFSAFSTGVRTTVNRFHSDLTVGWGDLQGDVEESAFLAWHYGYTAPLSARSNLLVDVGFVHVIPEDRTDPEQNDALHFAFQARLLGELRFTPRLAAFAGGGLSVVYDAYAADAAHETEPLLVVGVSLF